MDLNHQQFKTTHWSMVLAAGGNDSVAQNALEVLCQRYWFPLYCFVRHKGHSVEESEDLLQGFFTEVCAKEIIQKAKEERGRFRSFLIKCLQNYVVDQKKIQRAQKRGGGQIHFSLNVEAAEGMYSQEPADNITPESLFMKRWATTLLNNSIESLKVKYEQAEKGELFHALLPHLQGDSNTGTYKDLAEKFNQSENTIKSHISRLRDRFRKQMRDEITQTIDDSIDLDQEISDLFNILSS